MRIPQGHFRLFHGPRFKRVTAVQIIRTSDHLIAIQERGEVKKRQEKEENNNDFIPVFLNKERLRGNSRLFFVLYLPLFLLLSHRYLEYK